MKKTEALKAQYDRDGIVCLDYFDPPALSDYREYMQGKISKTFPDAGDMEQLDGKLWSGMFRAFGFTPHINEMICRLFTLPFCAFGITDPVVCNLPNLKIHFPNNSNHALTAHQDFPSHHCSMNAITVWIPLQDSSPDSGSIKYLRGSHQRSVIPSRGGLMLDAPDDADFESIDVSLGQCLIFSQMLIHQSGKNTTNYPVFNCQIRFADFSDREWRERKFESAERRVRDHKDHDANTNIEQNAMVSP